MWIYSSAESDAVAHVHELWLCGPWSPSCLLFKLREPFVVVLVNPAEDLPIVPCYYTTKSTIVLLSLLRSILRSIVSRGKVQE
jgi:hypothetical protein